MLKKFTRLTVATAIGVSLAGPVNAQDAAGVIAAASRAIGADGVKSLQYSGPGVEYSFGQAFKPGGPWPAWKNKTYTRTIDFDGRAVRIERVAEPRDPQRRGGGLPPAANQVIVFGAATPPAQQVALTLSPYGFLKAAAASGATVEPKKVGGKTVVTFTANKAKVNGYINDKNLVERVETWIDHPVTGDTHIEADFSEYKDFGGVKVPTRIVEKQEGFPILELTVTDAKINQAAKIQAPAGPPPAAPPALTSRKLGDGVYLILPAYAVIAVDFKDYIVMIECGQSEARAVAVINEAKRLFPGKPIRYVVNTHAHFDHSSGLRAFVAEGATILTHASNKKYLEQVLSKPHTINPDRQSEAKKPVRVEAMKDTKVLTDGTHTIELFRLIDLHQEGHVAAYFPKEKVLLEADGFLPPAQINATVANPVDPNPLLDNIRRLKLDVETIVPVHYPADLRPVAMSELVNRAALQNPPSR